MKTKKFIIIISLLCLTLLCGCSKQEQEKQSETFEFGIVNSSEEFKGKEVPNISFYVYGQNAFTIDSQDFKFNTYNLTTSINNTKDTSDWLGINVADLFKYLHEDFDKVQVFGANGIMSHTYSNLDNLYILVDKNGELIKFEKDNRVYILADITKDASEWLYNFESIKGIN